MSGEFSPCADHVRTTLGRAGPAVQRSSLTLGALPPGHLPTRVKPRIQSRALYIFPWLLLYLPSAPTGPIKEHHSLPATHPFSRARLFLEPPRLQSGPVDVEKGAKCLSHLKQPALPLRGLEFYDRRGGGKGKDAKSGQENGEGPKTGRACCLFPGAQLVVVQ